MSVTDITEPTIQSGPLPLPAGRSVRERLVAERLRSHLTSDAWLPAGLWPELDVLRDEHLRIRERLAGELNALAELHAGYQAEDQGHRQALKRSMTASGGEFKDERTLTADRDQAVQDALDRVWAAVEVLADHVDDTVKGIQASGDDWANDLGQQLLAAREHRRQAQLLLDRAQVAEHHVQVLGTWLDRTVSDGAMRGQPCPPLDLPQPAVVSVMDDVDDGIDDDDIDFDAAS